MRANLTTDQATRLVEELYGVKVTQIKELISYDDRNYYVVFEKSSWDNPHMDTIKSEGYVFKVLNSLDSQYSHAEAEHEMMAILARTNFNCPRPVVNKGGNTTSKEQIQNDHEANANHVTVHTCRLMTYVPGRVMTPRDLTPKLMTSLGVYVAKMHQALEGFDHEALHVLDFKWDLSNVSSTRKHLPLVEKEADRSLAETVLTEFELNVLAKHKDFRKGAIHGDLNEQNILVEECPTSTDPDLRVCGLIDFGDAAYNILVFDIAIALTYLMCNSGENYPGRTLEVGRYLLDGYTSVLGLNKSEGAILGTCVAARYVQSLLIGLHMHSQEPDNEDCLLTSRLGGWQHLRLLVETPHTELLDIWGLCSS